MSSALPRQSVPIIIKGGNIRSYRPIELESISYFRVTQEFQSQSDDWLESSSDFELSRVESINLVSPTGDAQFCQTSTMSHPLTFAFKDDQDKNIFIVSTVAATNDNYTLSINVEYSNSYFQISQQSSENAATEQSSENLTTEELWNNSIFTSGMEAEVAKIEVTDSSGTPVCQFLRSSDEQITLSLEPPV